MAFIFAITVLIQQYPMLGNMNIVILIDIALVFAICILIVLVIPKGSGPCQMSEAYTLHAEQVLWSLVFRAYCIQP